MSLAIGLTCAVMIAGMVIGSVAYMMADTIKEYTMGKTARGKRDGTGPHKNSARRKTSKTGKRIARGGKCPKR